VRKYCEGEVGIKIVDQITLEVKFMIRDQVLLDLRKALKKLKLPTRDIHLEHPAALEHGDYATNVALQLAKLPQGKIWHSSIELANEIAKLTQNYTRAYAKITVAKPGFINFILTQKTLLSSLIRINEAKDNFGRSDLGRGKTVVIDYSSPNVAKPFGIGHLRSTIIGQALYNIYQFLGWKCIGDSHIGDWGTQFGKLIYMIKREGLDPKKLTITDLERLYVQFHKEAETKPELKEEGRKWFKELEDGSKIARKIWKACIDLSLIEFNRIYDLLGVKIDYTLGESFYEDKMDEVIREAKKKGIAKKSEGAWIIEVPRMKVPLMLLKSDGATTYHTRDLATIKYRIKTWNSDLYIYETGVDHALHFKQLFAVAEKLGLGRPEQFVHVAHGMIRLPTGKLSTRKGKIVHLEDVLKEAITKAKQIAEKAGISKGLSKREQEEVARAVGIGAIKYNDLKQGPEKEVIFDWGKMLSLEGDSGPYLQYTHARAKNVLSKAQGQSFKDCPVDYGMSLEPEELSLLRTLCKFPEVVEQAGLTYAPNLICAFLFDLAQKFNLFYTKWPILKPAKDTSDGGPERSRRDSSEVEELRNFRLALTSATAQILKNGLCLLGIEPLERM
jgi:arginyl-tRNA synthetase